MGVKIKHHGNFKNIEKILTLHPKNRYRSILEKYGQQGVEALEYATPKDTGLTAFSWSYEIEEKDGSMAIYWKNSNIAGGYANVAVLIQYGHFTKNGGHVEGRDYINPALAPIFDKIADDAWREVTGN